MGTSDSEELYPTLYRIAEKLQSVWQLTREGGAYLREGTLRDLVKETKGQALHPGRLGYLPWRRKPNGSIQCDAKDVEWSEEPLCLRVDESRRPYICRLDERGREVERAYIGDKGKPFAELTWESHSDHSRK
ncbi:hypothetical protein [Kroppenstedtia sanguinis]|uniref:Uncharacterized protein n=1 Tax=Kroppenstedtia sanguinis TaxID=1380684 RepID=A0ABW4CBB2_9BACL